MDEKLKEAILIIINSISPMYSEIRLLRDDVQRLNEIAKDLKESEDNE